MGLKPPIVQVLKRFEYLDAITCRCGVWGSVEVELTNLVISGCGKLGNGLTLPNARDWSVHIPRTYLNRCLFISPQCSIDDLYCSIVVTITTTIYKLLNTARLTVRLVLAHLRCLDAILFHIFLIFALERLVEYLYGYGELDTAHSQV